MNFIENIQIYFLIVFVVWKGSNWLPNNNWSLILWSFLNLSRALLKLVAPGGVTLSVAKSMIDIHDNVDRYDAARKKRDEMMGKGRNGKKGEAKKHRVAMAVWSHRYPAELHDFRSTDLQVVPNPVELPRLYVSSSFYTLGIYRFMLPVGREIHMWNDKIVTSDSIAVLHNTIMKLQNFFLEMCYILLSVLCLYILQLQTFLCQ